MEWHSCDASPTTRATIARPMIPRTFAAPLLLAVAGTLTAPVRAQFPPALPYARTLDVLVVDTNADGVWHLADFNQDGDFNDAGEISSYYSDTLGAYAWTSPTAIVVAPDGT